MDSFFRQFKSVSDAMKEDLNRSKNGGTSQFSDRQRHLIKLIFSYMMSCKWQDTESTKKLMEVWDLPDSKAAERLNISANTVRSKRSSASKKLFDKLGEDVFNVLLSGDDKSLSRLERKLKYLTMGYDEVFKFVPKKVIDSAMLVPRSDDKNYDIRECKDELMFLARFDMIDMTESFMQIDSDKLAFLLEILMDCSFSGIDKASIVSLILRAQRKLKNGMRS